MNVVKRLNQRADLHLHTTASDGSWSPEVLIEKVQQAGIGLFAVTDHDSMDALAPTAELAREAGLHFLPGIELSARLDGQIFHLLAYGIDPADRDLQAFAKVNEARLLSASDDGVRLLAEAGHPVSLDEYATYTWDRQRGGWKALNYLIDKGLCHNVHSYFDELFAGDPKLPQADFPPPEEAVAVARAAGGTVILAHPGASFYNGVESTRLDDLVDMGVQGLECYAIYHDEATTRRFLDYCRSRDLLITGGSDCHGGFAGRTLGIPRLYTCDLQLGAIEDRILTSSKPSRFSTDTGPQGPVPSNQKVEP
jgi:predicted metal-dependent phosphoesterase TrpH